MTLQELTKALQELLKDAGFDPGAIDGIAGPKTVAALASWRAKHSPPEPPVEAVPPGTPVDARSEGIIATLHPQVQQPFRDLLHAINAQAVPQFGLTGKWISGYRGEAEQNALYAKGRTAPGPRVTGAQWPHSAHNGGGGKVGFACDIEFFDEHGREVENGPKYEGATALAIKTTRARGFHSGVEFDDPDHHCKRPPSMDALTETGFINEMIHRHENGIPLWP